MLAVMVSYNQYSLASLTMFAYFSLVGDGVTKDFFLSQRIENTWIGAYNFCRYNGMKLAKLTGNKQFTYLRSLSVRTSKFPPVFIDVMNSNENDQVSCKVSPSTMFPRAKVSKRFCDQSKGAFLCEDVQGSEIGMLKILEPKVGNDSMTLVGDFSEFLMKVFLISHSQFHFSSN